MYFRLNNITLELKADIGGEYVVAGVASLDAWRFLCLQLTNDDNTLTVFVDSVNSGSKVL